MRGSTRKTLSKAAGMLQLELVGAGLLPPPENRPQLYLQRRRVLRTVKRVWNSLSRDVRMNLSNNSHLLMQTLRMQLIDYGRLAKRSSD